MIARFPLSAFLVSLVGLLHSAVPPPPASFSSKLVWKNGETLSGDLVGGKGEGIEWRSPLFKDPLELAGSYLDSITFGTIAAQPGEPFSISLRDGSCLYGNLSGMDEKTVQLQSRVHGEVSIRREEVVRIQRLQDAPLIYSGPRGVAGWLIRNGRGKVDRPAEGPRGALSLDLWDQGFYLPITELPDRVEVEVLLHSTGRPVFALVLGSTPTDAKAPQVEVWDDQLVAAVGDLFTPIKKWDPSLRDAALRIFVDRKEGRFLVAEATGKVLADWKMPPLKDRLPGVLVHNKGADLTLNLLQVRAWDGGSPRSVDPAHPHVMLSDGSSIDGDVTRVDASGVVITPRNGSAGRTEPLDQVEAVVWPDHAPQAMPEATEIWFADGGLIRGPMIQVQNGVAVQQTTFSTAPVNSELKTVRRMHLHVASRPDDPKLTRTDKITLDRTSLHGAWAQSEDGSLLWSVPGSRRPCQIADTRIVEITCALPPSAAAAKPTSLFYLSSGDVIPAVLRDMDGSAVAFTSELTTATSLPFEQIRAIHFGGTGVKLNGFSDPGWRVTRGGSDTLEHSTEKVGIKVGSSFGHPSILVGDELKFDLTVDQGFGALRVRLFVPDVSATDQEASATHFLIGSLGNRLYCGKEARTGYLENQVQLTALANNTSTVRFVLQETQVEFWVNDVLVGKFNVPPSKRLGSGLVFEPGSLWGNGERPVHISALTIHGVPGRTALPSVASEARSRVLTVPRFHQEDLPRHVLVAANGDLLRGAIEAATATHFSFRTGLENVRVPRDRVTAAIWLKKPTAAPLKISPPAPPAPPFHPSHWIQLINGARIAMAVEKMTREAVLGRCALLGDCRVPIELIYSLRTTSPESLVASNFFEGWQLQLAPEPVLPTTGGQSSPMMGKTPKSFSIPLLTGGGAFRLENEKGKVIVLDFWATWCGPCIQSLPELMESMSPFPEDKVRFIAVNQAETPQVIQKFLDAHRWKLVTALDPQQKVAQQFGVEGIPHTVIIGRDGKIAWVKTGFSPGSGAEVAEEVKKLLKD